MTILSTDIKLRQSERMTDFDDGGGQMTAVEVIDGVLDNVFSDRSELDAIYGRDSLRKIYLQVDSANTDTYLGAFAFITDPPADGNVYVSMFDTASWTDERSDAANYVENYRIQGVKTQFTLYGLHIVGQLTVQFYCRDSTIPTPDIDDVLELSVEAAGYTPQTEFIKVDKVLSRQTLTFEDVVGTFTRDVLVIQITQPLTLQFTGIEDVARINPSPLPTVVRSTQISSSSTFYSIRPLAASAATGDFGVKVDSPFVPVVPASVSSVPLVDVLGSLGATSMVVSGAAASLTLSGASGAIGAGVSLTRYFGTPFARGTLAITIGATVLADDGIGNITSTTSGDTTWSGFADYANGAFTIAKTSSWSGTVSAAATPAGAIVQQTYSQRIDITSSNRDSLSFVIALPNLPSVGTTTIDYLSLNKWIRLTDQGNGTVSGNPGEGSATINYATGSIALTLGAFADAGSAIITAWGTDLRARDVHGSLTIPTPTYKQQLAHGANKPGTCSITWTSATVAKTGTVSSAGVISGDATGTWDMTNGIVYFTTASAPDAGFTYAYSWIDPTKVHQETVHPTLAGNQVSFTLAHPPAAFSLTATWADVPGIAADYFADVIGYTVRDDGSGGWIGTPTGTNTVNYSTGDITLTVQETRLWVVPTLEYNAVSGGTEARVTGWTPTSVGATFAAGSAVVVNYFESGATYTAASETYSAGPITILLNNGSTGPAVPGSVRLTFRGRTYVDRGGSLYYNVDPTTNSGTFGGTYDYAANAATLTDYATGNNTVTVVSLLTRYATTGVSNTYFRTPGAPINAGSLTWRATDLHGNTYTGATDINGNLTGTGAKGVVNQDSGTVLMQFGTYVPTAGNTGQPWYDAANVVGSNVWKPIIVDPATVFIGCVVSKSVPLSPSILGLDPVRLPSNGLVLCYNVGGVVCVHNTQVMSLTPTAGAVTNLGRTRLAFAEVMDSSATPVPIDPVWYTADLQAGTITWANPLNLSAYTMPVTIRHRIEDIAVCNDLQITGEIALQAALTHDFPESGSYASSCLIYGDMQSRVANVFDQVTWTSVFSDTLIGSAATSSFNNVASPITVVNNSATQDRWAAVFQSTSAVAIIGETAGNLGTFAISSDIAPINPTTGLPYFTIPHGGWGSGWSAGNVVRFNTIAANHPTWLLRCTVQGAITTTSDKFRLQIYGDAA